MITTILIFILVLGVLVFVHEFGHFIVARKSGMTVEEFGFGFPPRLVGIQKVNGKRKIVWGHKHNFASPGNTVYSINAIPFGGFVRILGENNEHEDDPGSFINKPFLSRFLTLVAGVVMNWILAVVLFSLVFMVGFPTELAENDPLIAQGRVSERQVAISYVQPGGPADRAGLLAQDVVESVDGQAFETRDQLQEYINRNKGKEFVFVVQRLNETKNIFIQSIAEPGPGEGPTGIAIADIGNVRLPFFAALRSGFEHTWTVTKLMVSSVWGLLSRVGQGLTGKDVDFGDVGGPVKIAQLTGQVADSGLLPLMNFTAFLSINLAILNILPIPALDGGRVLFLVIEKIRGKRNSQKVEQFVNTMGFVLLLLLMLIVTIKDIRSF